MNDDQIIIALLKEIKELLVKIESNTSDVYDLGDVCRRLDDITSAVKGLEK